MGKITTIALPLGENSSQLFSREGSGPSNLLIDPGTGGKFYCQTTMANQTPCTTDGIANAEIVAQEKASADGKSLKPKYRLYVNPRFGFSVEIPLVFSQMEPDPDNGDGAKFFSTDGRATVVASGSYNVLRDGPGRALAEAERHRKSGNSTATYTHIVGKTVTLTGLTDSGAEIYYERLLITKDVEVALTWEYPKSAASLYRKALLNSLATLRRT